MGASSRRSASGKKFSPSFVVLGGRRAPYVRLSVCVAGVGATDGGGVTGMRMRGSL